MYVVFIHGPAASGKYTIGTHLSALTGLRLFHNHLAVDAASELFEFGSKPFNVMRATIWLTAFAEAALAGRSFIFTFHPEASVDPAVIEQMVAAVESAGGAVHFVELTCPPATILQRIGNTSRTQFGKLTDPDFYQTLEAQGAFQFPALPVPVVTLDTGTLCAEEAAARIAAVLQELENSPHVETHAE
jgi:hypothetical protein